MDWIVVSLASAFAFAVVSVLEKLMLARYSPSVWTFIFLTGLLQIPGVVLVMLVVPLQSYPIDIWTSAFFSGFIWGVSLVIMFWVLNTQEVTRVIPVVSISPVFVAVLAVFFLSERLTGLQWGAILLTVSGAALVSMRRSRSGGGVTLGSSFYLLLVASVLTAVGQFLSKVALEEMSLWNMFVMRNGGLALACVLIALRPSLIAETRQVLADRVATGLFVVTEGVMVFVAVLLTIWAIDLGPVSLAATLMSTRPMFVLAFTVLLSSSVWKLLDEPLSRDTLALKFGATTMIVIGVSAIAFL